MKIGGLASGIDTEELVKKLMTAERMPLDKMKQQNQKLTWQRDGFRDINKSLAELDKMLFDMSLSTGYKIKNVSSTQESAVTATGSSSATDGTYDIEVKNLARGEMIISDQSTNSDFNIDKKLKDLNFTGNKLTFTTGNNPDKPVEIEIDIEKDTIKSVLKKINDKDAGIRAFYDDKSSQIVMETTYTGKHRDEEISFGKYENSDGADFFNDILGFGRSREVDPNIPDKPPAVKYFAAEDAVFTYNNGLDLTSPTNSYELNGITFNFKNETKEGPAKLSVTNDTDKAFDNVMKFINKYNEVVEKLNGTQQEAKYRNFQPLTDEQKKEMSEDQIKQWEEKAKSGLLKGEGLITNALFSMRGNFYSKVNTDGKYKSISDLGLGTSKNYMDGGKIVLENGSEDKLRKALAEDPDAVMKLFTANGSDEKGTDAGIIKKLRASIKTTTDQINERAGKPSDTTEKYTIGKNMKDLDKRISNFEKKLTQIETRYWNQFNAMEKAINKLNSQSAQMLSQFGGQ
ncbi:flagellar hook-associated protein 2 [Aciduricibacillus chroicocephali]|uniref:Flagellar hook-associated protein 2 n=1 Tax=Aciduricibacillus chroicocephali TaxID=3054939 RepID=A0ABY9KT30_9BACI|nr:flagellar hook-associated protein 2 [Bacillaceae bacterium 44XB]